MAFGQPFDPSPYKAGFVNIPQQGPLAQAVAPKPKINWLGVLADALSGAAGQTPLYTQSILQQRAQQQEEDRYQRHRQDNLNDEIARYQYELDHPKPVNNDTANDYEFWKSRLSPEQFQTYVNNKINPPRYMEIPGVGLVQVPTGGATPPVAPVGKLTPIGGPTPRASGGFPSGR